MRPAPTLLLTGALLAGLAVGAFALLRSDVPAPAPASHSTAEPAPEAAPVVEWDEFGLEADAFVTVDQQIRRNQTFSDLLGGFNVPYERIVLAAQQSRPVFDVRHLRAGKNVRIYHTPDSLRTAQYFVYQQDPIRYVVFDLSTDSLAVYEGERPVETREREVSGVITSSLYETLVQQDVSPRLASDLAEIFAWQIDFYRIQDGDNFRVVFEEQWVDDDIVGLGAVHAARFQHVGKDYYAFRFEQDGFVDYFDPEGNSLRKAFLISPVKYSRISSRYTGRRFHPVQKRWKAHLGTDYAAPRGTPIRATGDGTVVEAQFKRYNGNYVKVRHNGTYTTQYLHMSKIEKGIRPGARVRQGDVIGYVGSTGLATGPHVCYRFWKHGQQVDHLREEFPASHPVEEAHRARFAQTRDQLMQRLLEAPPPQYAALRTPTDAPDAGATAM